MSRDKAFKAALDYATEQVERWLKSQPLGPSRSPDEYLMWWAFKFRHIKGPDGKVWIDAPSASISVLADLAVTSAGARKLMRELVSSKLLAEQLLSLSESRFAALELIGALPKISGRAGVAQSTNFERNLFALGLAQQLSREFGLTLSRNDAAKTPMSACDAVSEAFAANGRHEVTFKTLKELSHKKALRKTMAALAVSMAESQNLARSPFLKALEG